MKPIRLILCIDTVYLRRAGLHTAIARQPLWGRVRSVHNQPPAIINLAGVGVGAVIAAVFLLWVGVSFSYF
jgi:hypothetical protein